MNGDAFVLVISLVITGIVARSVYDVKKLKVHTHAADGSINGIRGWY